MWRKLSKYMCTCAQKNRENIKMYINREGELRTWEKTDFYQDWRDVLVSLYVCSNVNRSVRLSALDRHKRKDRLVDSVLKH